MTESPPPRTPPRFVPVLTEVVHPGTPAASPWQASTVTALPLSRPTAEFASAAPVPVISTPPEPAPLPAAKPAPVALEALEEQLIHRVMQRVDVALERQLHDAVAAMVLQHSQALVPRLREEVEFVVRQAVSDAVAAELAEREPPSA